MAFPFHRWLLAASLANLLLLRELASLVNTAADGYWSPEIPSPTYLGMVCAWLVLSFLCYLVLRGAQQERRRWLRRACDLGICAALLWVLHRLVDIAAPQLTLPYILGNWGARGNRLKSVLGLLAFTTALAWRIEKVRVVTRYAIGWASPLLLFTLVKLTGLAIQHHRRAHPVTTMALPVSGEHGLIIWMIFDEWSEHYTSSDRPAALHLPAIDAFRATALSAKAAYSPAKVTQASIPALLQERVVSSAQPLGRFRLKLHFCDESPAALLGDRPNFFSEMRAIGIPARLLGWYHPYCRVFHADVEECLPVNGMRDYTRFTLLNTARILKRTIKDEPMAEEVHWEIVKDIRRSLAREIDGYDPAAGTRVIFVHWPIPHMPELRRAEARPYPGESPEAVAYFHNLELTDQVLGELRAHLEQRGLWEAATLLVSSDHWWRAERIVNVDAPFHILAERYRVPFLLKLPHQHRAASYGRAFNTIVSGRLLRAVAQGEVSTARQVSDWLTGHRVDYIPILANPTEDQLPNGSCHYRLPLYPLTASGPRSASAGE